MDTRDWYGIADEALRPNLNILREIGALSAGSIVDQFGVSVRDQAIHSVLGTRAYLQTYSQSRTAAMTTIAR